MNLQDVRMATWHFYEVAMEVPLSNVTDLDYEMVDDDKRGEVMVIAITTHRPGILIGRRGELIDKYRTYMENAYSLPVRIQLNECTLWHMEKTNV